jgi:signal recognition particle subunit SRP54
MKGQMAEAGFDDKVLRRQIALIQSMTKKERANPDLLQASRKKRIAAGIGAWRCPSSTSFSRCTARWRT